MTNAQKMFQENMDLLGARSGQTTPLEHNLYRGLYALATESEAIQRQLEGMAQELVALHKEIRKLKH